MKIKFEVSIAGLPAKLNFRAKLLYGNKEQFEKKIFTRQFSLDKGGSVITSMTFFSDYAKECGCTDEISK